jgi:hypothetical protein
MKVYVYEGYNQGGGTYVAYHLGRVLYKYFGLEVIIVGERPESTIFSYAIDFPNVSAAEFQNLPKKEDLLICNPSFSHYMFGLRLPCKKISYIQGIRTFAVLDIFFDRYVFVSNWARKFINDYYGVSGNVIPAFVQKEFINTVDDWLMRLPSVLILEYKFENNIFCRFLEIFRAKYPDCKVEFKRVPLMPQNQLAALFKRHRYYISFTTMEGFGLPMLEAMASGCTVVGWDAGGSAEYAVHGKNCLLSKYGDFESLAKNLYYIINDASEAERLAHSASRTGKRFSIERFDRAWIDEFSQFLSLPHKSYSL